MVEALLGVLHNKHIADVKSVPYTVCNRPMDDSPLDVTDA